MTVRLAVSVGCASGIGPEVSVVAAREIQKACVLLVGDRGALTRAAEARHVKPPQFVDDPRSVTGAGVFGWQPGPSLATEDRVLGAPTKRTGVAQLSWIDQACDLVSSKDWHALVTGPVSKEAIARSGAAGAKGFVGHTEHLQKRLRAREVIMAFWSARLTTSLATTHLALSQVPRAVTRVSVARATFWLATLLIELGHKQPRIAVAALNPHAGERGLLGKDEARIEKGIELARERLQNAHKIALISGPIPAETAMRLGASGAFEGVVAMYHDQATIPMKLLAFGDEVNVSLGLPIIRTSVDHGTAYDRAPRFDADAKAMITAMKLASRLAGSPRN